MGGGKESWKLSKCMTREFQETQSAPILNQQDPNPARHSAMRLM
jgi:hypothetical protein